VCQHPSSKIDEALVEVKELALFSAVAGGRVDQLETVRAEGVNAKS
jgi:hypothetical protein